MDRIVGVNSRIGAVALTAAAEAPHPARSERRSNAPLAALAGGTLARRFHAWRGRSGERHVFSVFAIGLDDLPDFEDAVIIAAGVRTDGEREILLLRRQAIL